MKWWKKKFYCFGKTVEKKKKNSAVFGKTVEKKILIFFLLFLKNGVERKIISAVFRKKVENFFFLSQLHHRTFPLK